MAIHATAIIIPTRNRHELLKRCLGRLIPYLRVHPECTIIVSDDGDALQTRKTLAERLCEVQVVQGPCRGPAANRNCGAAHAAAELLIFLDDDCIPDPDLIAVYQDAALSNPKVGVFERRRALRTMFQRMKQEGTYGPAILLFGKICSRRSTDSMNAFPLRPLKT